MVRITRRDFLKYCSVAAGALGLSASTLMKLENAYARETVNGGIPVIWIDGAACTGCSMTLLNSVFYTDVADLLINTLDLNFHKTVMTACGADSAALTTNTANALAVCQQAYSGMDAWPLNALSGGTATSSAVPLYVLVVEGGIQCAKTPGTGGKVGGYCENGDLTGATLTNDTMLANTQLLASHALAVLSVGTCASFGGIPGARGSATDSRGTLYKGTKANKGALLDPSVAYNSTTNAFSNALGSYAFTSSSPLTNILGMPIKDVTINIPGCPPHPDWIVGTIASIVSGLPPIATILNLIADGDVAEIQSILRGALPAVTSYKRPIDYGYREYQCNAGPCAWRYNNTANRTNNNDTSYTNSWTGNPYEYPTTLAWTDVGGPAGTYGPPSTNYPPEPDWNRRYPEGDSKKLGREKWANQAQGCLGILGCKGRKTKADCSRRRWNAQNAEEYGVNWCVGSRGACQGCTEPTFPDGVGKFYTFI